LALLSFFVNEEPPGRRERVHWFWVIGGTLVGARVLVFTLVENQTLCLTPRVKSVRDSSWQRLCSS